MGRTSSRVGSYSRVAVLASITSVIHTVWIIVVMIFVAYGVITYHR